MDPICTLIFSVVILVLSLTVIRDGWEVLLDMAPRDVDLEKIREHLRRIRGVIGVHDLHCWYVAYGEKALSCHVHVNKRYSGSICTEGVLKQAKVVLAKYGIEHTTIQVEDPDHKPADHILVGRQLALCEDHLHESTAERKSISEPLLKPEQLALDMRD